MSTEQTEYKHRAPSMIRSINETLSPEGYAYASDWFLFKTAGFGRDSQEVAEDLIDDMPKIAQATIRWIPTLQGRKFNSRTEEEPGKIHHENRRLVINGQKVDEDSEKVFYSVGRHLGLFESEEALNNAQEWTYNGTVDATPLYVRLVSKYCERYGTAILDEEYTPYDWKEGEQKPTIRESVYSATKWIENKINDSSRGFLEWQRMNPKGHRFQAWKDGSTSYLHPNGEFVNYNAPIADIAVQGLAYDALNGAQLLLANTYPKEAEKWGIMASDLQTRTMDEFWTKGEDYPAMALDYVPGTYNPKTRLGENRKVELVSSNGGALLDTGIFDTLPPFERRQKISGIVKRITSDEFLTVAGVRCTSLKHKDLLDYPAYQSPQTVWHKETNDIARGLNRQGFPQAARALEALLLNGINISGRASEFLYVMPDGRVHYDPFNLRPISGKVETINATNQPENIQAWSASAAYRAKRIRGNLGFTATTYSPWAAALDAELVTDMKDRNLPIDPIKTHEKLAEAFPTDYTFVIDTDAGKKLEGEFIKEHQV